MQSLTAQTEEKSWQLHAATTGGRNTNLISSAALNKNVGHKPQKPLLEFKVQTLLSEIEKESKLVEQAQKIVQGLQEATYEKVVSSL